MRPIALGLLAGGCFDAEEDRFDFHPQVTQVSLEDAKAPAESLIVKLPQKDRGRQFGVVHKAFNKIRREGGHPRWSTGAGHHRHPLRAKRSPNGFPVEIQAPGDMSNGDFFGPV